MIISELLEDGTLIRHYSDAGMIIQQIETGILYSEAVDTEPCRYIYEETDVPVETAILNPDIIGLKIKMEVKKL